MLARRGGRAEARRSLKATPRPGRSSHPLNEARYTEIVTELEVQFVSNEDGEATAVIVPISLWREIQSERETAYLLKSPAMKRRLLEAKERDTGLPLEAALEKLGV